MNVQAMPANAGHHPLARRLGSALLALGLALPSGGAAQTLRGPVRGGAEVKSRPAFTWKALWVQAAPLKNKGHMELMARRAKQMGFNVIIAAPSADMASAVHGQGLQLYAWVSALQGLAPTGFAQAHPGYLQLVAPEEEAQAGAPRANPDRENVQPGPWLCPDHGLLPAEREALESLARKYPLEGVALDNLGYRNYYACFCQFSETWRASYARRHPTLLRSQILRAFSERALTVYVLQFSAAVKGVNPRLKLAIHIHPDFDPNPFYGNLLEVDYCGETIAGGSPPFWPYVTVAARTRLFLEAEGDFDGDNRFVPFIAVLPGAQKKTPQRLQAEIRIARSAGTGTIMLGYYAALAAHPDLADVVARELR